ncbi:MAG: 4Fe-4S binding protein [Candidatus Lernaella stagnicola]|nr:4Fe-4S binding protein [Candidatus Lernaella stagnicola]
MSVRRGFQLFFLLVFFVLIGLTTYPLKTPVPVELFLRMDPLLLIGASLAARTAVAGLGAAFVILAATALLGRFFCGWICPLGTTIELADDLLQRKGKRRYRNHERVGRWFKYVHLLIVMTAAAAGYGLAFLFDPIALFTRISAYLLHPATAFVGNAGLDAMRPLAGKADWLTLYYLDLHQPLLSSGAIVAAIMLVGILWLNRVQRRFWCRSVCPLGALLGLAARLTPFPRHVGAACDHDGKCRRVCETGAIGENEFEYDPAECINCNRCVTDCHLHVVRFGPGSPLLRLGRPLDLTRRRLLAGLAGGAFGALLFHGSPARAVQSDTLLRPPGALPEDEFRKRCIRCGQCVKACPTNTLQPDWFESGLEGLWSPLHRMRVGPCDQGCNVCGSVCPTGAIRPLDLYEKRYAKIGTAVIDQQRCVVWAGERFCLVCDEACPYNAIFFVQDEQGKRRPYVDRTRCNGCGQCETVCPVAGAGAIVIRPDNEIRLAEGSYVAEAERRGYKFEKGVAEDEFKGEGGYPEAQ